MAGPRYTDSAENDLLNAWLYIAADNPAAADRILESIDQEARLLTTQPRMGRERHELAAGLRSWPTSTPYILYYFVDAAGILIARVLHHARGQEAIPSWPGATGI